MTVKIGNKPVESMPVEPEIDVTNMSIIDRLKLAKKAMEAKYGPVAIFKLPNDKRVFLRAPTPQEFQIYNTKLERQSWANSKGQPTETVYDIVAAQVKSCMIVTNDNSFIANTDDLAMYPACFGLLNNKLLAMAGSDVEEDFLD
jgi:hypothetical protein